MIDSVTLKRIEKIETQLLSTIEGVNKLTELVARLTKQLLPTDDTYPTTSETAKPFTSHPTKFTGEKDEH